MLYIDKSDPIENSEAINSMYHRYRNRVGENHGYLRWTTTFMPYHNSAVCLGGCAVSQ